jgi:hypothetical protein
MTRRVSLGLVCVLAFNWPLTDASTGAAVEIPDAQAYAKACVDDTSASKSMVQTKDYTIYTCWGAIAQRFFDYLETTKAPQTMDKQRTGTYVFRTVPQGGRCWNKTENSGDVPTSVFGCSINVTRPKNSTE